MIGARAWVLPLAALASLALLPGGPRLDPAHELVLVGPDTAMRFLANVTDPRLGTRWALPGFDDRRWTEGRFGIGFDASSGGAASLLATRVPRLAQSVYTRTVITLDDLTGIENVVVGADYDDGFAIWINGTEVFRSPELRPGELAWLQRPQEHESSNGTSPRVLPTTGITARALPALRPGRNVIAVAVWNASPLSDDLVLVPFVSLNHPPDIVRGPYLQRASPGAMVIRWRTNRPSDSQVWLGPASGELVAWAGDATLTTEHEVELTGLSPETTSHYGVGDTTRMHAGNLLEEQSFTTPPPVGSSRPTRIWVLGDSGTADRPARAVADAYRRIGTPRQTDLWLMLGDNAYNAGTDAQYQRAVFDMYPDFLRTSVLWPTLGNHDSVTADSATQTGPYYEIFTLPDEGESGGVPSGTEAYYAFDHGSIHFICLESHETDRSAGSAMLQWLEEDLAATSQEWIVAFFHHPPYSKGSHDSDDEIRQIQMRENALPILEAGGVDLVLTGHSHSYERSVLIDGHYGRSSTLTPEMVLDAGSGRPETTGAYVKPGGGPAPHKGAVYVVAGNAGQLAPGDLDHPVMIVSLMRLGSLVLDIDGDRLDVRFLAVPGQVADRFTLMKQAAGSRGGMEPSSPPF